jgi:hypothetical protein
MWESLIWLHNNIITSFDPIDSHQKYFQVHSNMVVFLGLGPGPSCDLHETLATQ